MKIQSGKILSIIFVAGLISFIQTGSKLYGQNFEYVNEKPAEPLIYVGLGLGVNDYGLGFNAELPFSGNFSINGNLGLGGWGGKIGGSLNFYPDKDERKSEYSLGYSRASGFQNFKTALWIEPDNLEQTVVLDLNMVETINISYTYNLKVGKSSKLGFSAGYAIPITNHPYRIDSPVTITETSRLLLNIMQPGGLIIGFRFMTGIL